MPNAFIVKSRGLENGFCVYWKWNKKHYYRSVHIIKNTLSFDDVARIISKQQWKESLNIKTLGDNHESSISRKYHNR